MNATERVAFAQSVALYDDLHAVVDAKTIEILDRRRRTAVIKRRGWLMRRMLLLADVVGLFAAFLIAQYAFGDADNPLNRVREDTEWLLFLLTLPGWIVVAKLYGLYDRDEERTDHSTVDDALGVFHLVTVGAWLFFAATALTSVARPHTPKLFTFWVLAIALIALGRGAARGICRRSVTYLQNTVIVGAGDVGQTVASKLLNHPEYGINLVGFVDDEPRDRRDGLAHLALLGGRDRLPGLIRLLDVERVIIAFSNDSHEETLDLVRSLKDLDVQIDIVPRLFELVGPNVGFHSVEGLPLVGLPPMHLSLSSRMLKRAVDVVLSSLGLLFLSPFIAVVALAIKLDSPGPVFYRHERVGRNGRRFELFKFRTMQLEYCRGADYGGDQAERAFQLLMDDEAMRSEFATTYKLRNDPRVTRVGAFLRRTSLDELPQLLNVVVSDISLVGPRPVTIDEAALYGDGWDAVLNIRPGITGYWQINGRNSLAYQDRVRLDLAYIANWSLSLDLAILAKTLRVLIARRGAF